MKIYKFIGIVLALSAASLMVSSCGGTKKVAANQGEKELEVPLSSKEYRSDATYFRETATGKSPDMATAKKIALMNARTQLASNIATTVKAVSEQYINQVSIANKQEYASKFEETSRNVVNQEISGVTIKDEKVFKSKEGTYTYYVNIEMPKAKIAEGVADAISKDQKMALEFDKFLFQKTFDAEMAKFEENN